MSTPAVPYTPLPNSFRQRLLAGETLIGCWTSLVGATAVEVLGLAGFDWLLLDGEHAPNDVVTFIPQLMALKDSVSAPVARPASNDAVEIKRLLDAGFFNILVPMVETVEEAEAAVAATRYPPQGIRGVSVSTRSNRFGTVPRYFETINDHICVLVQIESRRGLEAAREIAAVAGVDGVFIGPADLSAACGHLNDSEHPQSQAAIKAVFDAVHAAGKAIGILAPVEAHARRYLAMGARFVAVGSDLGVLRNATQALRDTFKNL